MFDGREIKFEVGADGSIRITGLEAAILGQQNPELRRQLRGLHKAYRELRMKYEEALRSNRCLRDRLDCEKVIMRQHTRRHIVQDVKLVIYYPEGIQSLYLSGHCPECGKDVDGHFAETGAVTEDECWCPKCGNYLIWDDRSLVRRKGFNAPEG